MTKPDEEETHPLLDLADPNLMFVESDLAGVGLVAEAIADAVSSRPAALAKS